MALVEEVPAGLNLNLYEGQTFKTFSGFEVLLKRRRDILNEKLVKGNGNMTVMLANSKIKDVRRHYRISFQYAWVNYRCIHEGQFDSRGNIRECKSNKIGCPVKLKIVARREKDNLEVVKCDLNHSHNLPSTSRKGFDTTMPRHLPLDLAEPLIRSVQERDILYNARHPHYKNRNLTELAWKEVANQVQRDVSYCKSTWATLRASFNRIMAQLPQWSGAPAKPPKWYLFSNMAFLKDHVANGQATTRLWNSSGVHEQQTVEVEDNRVHESGNGEYEENSSCNDFLAEVVDDYQISQKTEADDSEPSLSPSPSYNNLPRLPNPMPAIKRNHSEVDIDIDPVGKAIIDFIEKKSKNADLVEEEGPIPVFMKSLVPFINKLTETNKHKFMAQTTTILMDMIISQDSHD